MSSGDFIYRLKQKWKYHTARDKFERKVAEINRNELRIIVKKTQFKIVGFEIEFTKTKHAFIIDRLDLFIALLNMPGSKISIDKGILRYETGDLKLIITTSEEIYIIYEIFVKGCYDVITADEFNVIDIGMNVGFASLFFARNPNINQVYGFEPLTPTYNVAKANFDLNTKYSKKILHKNIGLGFKDENVKVNYNRIFKGKSTTIDPGVNHSMEVQIKRADKVIESIVNENPSDKYLIKMDCEGAEFEIFKIMENKILGDQLFGFIIEWHNRDPKPIIDVLTKNQFKIHKMKNGELGLIIAFR